MRSICVGSSDSNSGEKLAGGAYFRRPSSPPSRNRQLTFADELLLKCFALTKRYPIISVQFCASPDYWKEHAVKVEVPEVAGDLDPVEEEGHDGHGEVEGHPDVVPLLDEGLRK